MLSIKYNISISNPVADKLKPSESYLEQSTLSVKEVSTGYVIKGFYKKNKEILVASSNTFIGEDFHLKSGKGNKTYLEDKQSFLDVERVFAIKGKNLSEVDKDIKNSVNVASYVKDDIFKLKHILAQREDAIFFKVSPLGILELISVTCQEPSNLIKYTDPNAFIIYFIVNKTLKVTPYKDFYISNKQLEDLPQGFCTLSNELLLNNTVSLENLSTNNYVLKGITPTTLTSSFPIKIDNVKLTTYQTIPKEILLISVDTDFNTPLDSIDLNLVDNITAIYSIEADGSLEPYLAVITKGLLDVDDSMLINAAHAKRVDVLTSDIEFRKNYIVKQYKITLKDSLNKEYVLYDESFYKNISHDIPRFNKKIVKNDN